MSLCLEQLSLLLTQHPSPLISLLGERNIEGHTPFMAAVYYKVIVTSAVLNYHFPPSLPPSVPQAYSVALQLLDLALSVSNGDQTRLLAALYPSDCHPDDNPVFVLCRNDNCSFTWTGELHIHQVIPEAWGYMLSLSFSLSPRTYLCVVAVASLTPCVAVRSVPTLVIVDMTASLRRPVQLPTVTAGSGAAANAWPRLLMPPDSASCTNSWLPPPWPTR